MVSSATAGGRTCDASRAQVAMDLTPRVLHHWDDKQLLGARNPMCVWGGAHAGNYCWEDVRGLERADRSVEVVEERTVHVLLGSLRLQTKGHRDSMRTSTCVWHFASPVWFVRWCAVANYIVDS